MIRVIVDDAEVRRALERMGRGAAGRTLESALVGGAVVVQTRAKQNAHVVTGTLRRSIHIGGHTDLAAGFDESQGYGDIGGNESDGEHAIVYVGTDLAYAAREEYGFVGADSLGRVYNQPAHPYLEPAFVESEDEATREVEAALYELILRDAGA